MSDYDSVSSYESRRTNSETRRSQISARRRSDESDLKSDHMADDVVDVYGSDDDHYASFDVDSDESQDSDIHARERFDPNEGDNPEKLTGGMRDYVYKHFSLHLKDEVIKDKILKDTPVPVNTIFSAPQLDEFVEELIDDRKALMYTKIHDGSIKFIQKRIGQVMGPLTKIWKTVDEGVTGKSEDPNMSIDELLKLLEKTVLLLGQANVACLYERRLNVLSKVFGDAKKARKSISTNEKSFADGTQGKLLGDDYYKVLEKYSKSKKRAREITDSLGPSKKRGRYDDQRRRQDQGQGQNQRGFQSQRRPFRGGPSRRGRGGRSSSYSNSGRRYVSLFNKGINKSCVVRGNSTERIRRIDKVGVCKTSHRFKFCTSRGTVSPVSAKLGIYHKRSYNSGGNIWLQNRIHRNTRNKLECKSPPAYEKGKSRYHRERNCRAAHKEGSRDGRISSSRSHSGVQQYFHSSEKRRGAETNIQFEGTEQIHSIRTFQNGGLLCSKKFTSKRRLYGESGSKRCLSHCKSTRKCTEISEIQKQSRSGATVQSPSFWLGIRSPSLHENNETSGSTIKTIGYSSGDILGRHTYNEQKSHFSGEGQGFPDLVVAKPGVHSELGKVGIGAMPENRISGLDDQFGIDGGIPISRENSENSNEMQIGLDSRESDDSGGSEFTRSLELVKGGNCADHTVCTTNANASNKAINDKQNIPSSDRAFPSVQGGNSLVDKSCSSIQWETNTDSQPGFSNRDRCIKPGLGRGVPRSKNGGSLDQRREILAHKCSRIERSPSSTTINSQSKEKYVSSFKNGQHNCSGPHKPHGGNKIKNTKSNNSPNLGILLGEGDNSHSRIPSWSAKRNGRLGKSSCKIILPVETEYQDIQTTEQNLGPNRGRLVCRQTEQSSPPILQPQTGSRGTGGGCISDRMDEPQCLCVSSILSDNESASKSNQGGIRFNNNNPVLADTRSLPDASEHDDRFSHIVTTNEGTSTVTGRGVPPTSCELDAKTSGMESVREQAKARGFSQGASNLLVSSWRKGTQSSYNTCWKYWNSWCCERNVDPIQAPVEQVANFLAELYNKGYAYSSINSYRSAISACHFGMNGTPIGQHSVICRLMGGIFNERPIQPRYTCTWDVDTVLKFLNSKEDNEKLSLKDLTLKVTILIALSSACRSSEVSRLDMNFMKIDNDSIKFSIPTLTKGRRCGDPPVEIVLGKFQAQPKLDVVSCILEYVNRTQNIREGETILLVSYIKPHKQVRPCTVAKWIQQIMKLSGIDTSTFKAHSTRGASTSKANKQGLSVPQIMKMAKWKSECTFRRFYSRTIEGETGNSDHTFSDAVFHI